MKHKIIIIVSLILVFTLGVLSVRAYDQYKVYHQKQVVAQQVADQKERVRQSLVAQELLRIKAECEKSKLAYNALTPAVKAKTPAPNCELQLVQ